MLRVAIGILIVAFASAFGVSQKARAQAPKIEWQKCLGGGGYDRIQAMVPTSDSGYALVGYTQSNLPLYHGNGDGWVVKLDKTGTVQWQKCYGGSSTDGEQFECVVQTSDGGFAVAGEAGPNSGDISGFHGGDYDAWVVKLDDTGAIKWQLCIGGSNDESAHSIIQTPDGGFVISGETNSRDGDMAASGTHGDGWVAKVNSSGVLQWIKFYGGLMGGDVNSIIQTTDNGFAFAGYVTSNGGNVSGFHVGEYGDEWIVKLDDTGAIQWQKCLGGTDDDVPFSIVQTTDGGFAVAGCTNSDDGDVTGDHGSLDYWVVKLNDTGRIVWEKCLGGSGYDVAYSIVQTSDSGFAIGGYTTSNDGDVSGNHGGQNTSDFWVVKLDKAGNTEWKKCLGGSQSEETYAICQTMDKKLAVAGQTSSNDGDVSGYIGGSDGWIVKLAPPPPPPIVSYITPDAGAPGMCVAVDIVGPDSLTLNLGNDATYLPGSVVTYVHPSDSALVRLGPSVSGWGGRYLQTMLMIEPDIPSLDTSVMLQVSIFGGTSAPFTFHIMKPRHIGTLQGGGVFGQNIITARNTMVVDSLILENGTYTFSTTDPDHSTPGNQGYLPARILSSGPIRLINANFSVDGQAAKTGSYGGAGGPGGGGGGSGYPGDGGDGFTGGGGMGENSSPGSTHGGAGTGGTTGSRYYYGGQSLNGIPGGYGMEHNGLSYDEGAGGGTGFPFGISGAAGVYNASSPYGGEGAGSGAGSVGTTTNFGGGGAGYATDGTPGQGNGDNRGHMHGDIALAPFAGGSGGGSGNVTHFTTGQGGSGGGGGGAIELTSFSNFDFQSGSITANGGKGSNGVSGFLEPGAGGGGGSGGAVFISARDSIDISSAASIVENGGTGGSGSNSGGSGGLGRTRIDGYVSKVNGNASSSAFYSTNKDYTGPSIQRAVFAKDSVTVIGYAAAWDGLPNRNALATIELRWLWPSTGAWQFAGAVPVADPSSHTFKWTITIPRSKKPADSEVYLSSMLLESVTGGSWPMMALMSHTSGMIAKAPKLPEALVNIATIDFGNVSVGQCKDTTLEVYSVGDADLVITSIAISGSGTSQFTVLTATPLDVKPGDSAAISVRFCPATRACPITATLTINNTDTQKIVQLTGCGVQAVMDVSPFALDFGRVHIGDCKDSFVVVSNPGEDTLIITAEAIHDPRFTVLDPLPIIVPAGDSVQLHLQYCPTDTIITLANDSIVGNAPESPFSLTLLGEGKIGILSLPPILDFGLVHDGGCKDSGFYAVNSGNDSLLVTRNEISAPNFTVISPQTPFAINAGDSVFVTIRFCSPDTGSFSAFDTLASDIPSQPTILLLAHTGIGILSIPNVIDFGSVPTGGCADSLVAISNIGTDTLVLVPSATFTAPFSYNGPSPLRLAPGEMTTIDLRFCPVDTNSVSEIASLDTIGPGISPEFTLLGKGVEGILATSGPIDFGCIALDTSGTQIVTLKNTGAAALTNLSVTILPSGAATIVHSPPATFAAGATDSVVVIVVGSSIGSVSATLLMTWNGGGQINLPITAQVSPPPKITSLDTTIAYDTTNVGDSTIEQCVTITNYSCSALPLDSVLIASGISGEFEIVSDNTGKSISDSALGTICIRYKPLRGGPSAGELLVKSGNDTVKIATLTGNGIGAAVGVRLAIDTIAGRPGDIVDVPVRALNDITSAAISSLTFRVTFDPMQLDMKAPVSPFSVTNAGGSVPNSVQSVLTASPTATYSVKKYSIGDQEITATYSSPLTGTPIVAELPFEILLPTANTASVHLMSASFGASLATLASANDGLIEIEQCDTNERITIQPTPIDVAPISPNPLSSRAQVAVDVNISGHVRMEVFNALGERMMTAFDADVPTGQIAIEIDAGGLASGAYRCETTWSGPGQTVRDENTMVVMR